MYFKEQPLPRLSNPGSSKIRFPQQMVGLTGLEPVTPRLSSACSNQLSYKPTLTSLHPGGAEETRTPDIVLAKHSLYHLSYSPPKIELCDTLILLSLFS